MNGVHVEAMTRDRPWNATVDRKTALKVMGGCFALIAGAPRLEPSVVKANHDGTWHPSGGSGSGFHLAPLLISSYQTSASGDTRVDLRVTIAPDGSAQMDGAILVVSALEGPMPLDDPGPIRRLVARGTDTQASCADADGDGHAGIIQIAADLEDAQSGEPVRIVLETEPTRDIDERGTYSLILVIGDERWTVNARVTLAPARGRKSRKRRRKGRRRR